jgi:imidazolonepropionase-like amidohydrolase
VGGRIYPAPDAPAIDDGVVLVRSGKIVQVGTRRSVNIPAGTAILDCKGKFITSGFQNSHVHFTEAKWDRAADQPASKLTEQLQAMLVRYGFTTVVDTGSLLSNTAALRFRIDSGEVTGPRIFTAGVPLYPPNGIPYYVKDVLPAALLKQLPQPSTPEEAADFILRNVGGGANIVKLFTGSWVGTQSVLPMPDDVAFATAEDRR